MPHLLLLKNPLNTSRTWILLQILSPIRVLMIQIHLSRNFLLNFIKVQSLLINTLWINVFKQLWLALNLQVWLWVSEINALNSLCPVHLVKISQRVDGIRHLCFYPIVQHLAFPAEVRPIQDLSSCGDRDGSFWLCSFGLLVHALCHGVAWNTLLGLESLQYVCHLCQIAWVWAC